MSSLAGRPDPDTLLKRIQEENGGTSGKRGVLKIFLGYAAGVGKTYTMLEEAQALHREGVDIVAGLVETHGRAETENLLKNLPVIPPVLCEHGGILTREMDLDAVLRRLPRIVLVDELAHTNASCMRHSKRYQDVEELLESGISVYATLNVQHIESLNDAVLDITRVRVEETVPDRIIEMAHDIELIDIPPETLLERFKEGKVYLPEKARQAMTHFFQKGHLLGLRELSLRYTAWKVDSDMRSYMTSHSILGPWPAGTRLLVCVSPSPLSKHAIRAARQLAEGLDADWFAVYVEPERQAMSDEDRDQLSRNLKLAEDLGSTVRVITGHDVVDEIIRFARDTNITLIVAGSPRRPVWQELIRGPLVYDLVRKSGMIDVLVVGSPHDVTRKVATKAVGPKTGWYSIAGPIVLTTLVTIVLYLSQAHLEFLNIAMLFLIPVLVAAVLWGRTAGVLTGVLSVIALDYFFVRPTFSFAVEDLRYVPSFLVFLLVALATSTLAEDLRRRSVVSDQRDRFISAIFSFTTMLLSFPGRENGREGLDAILVQAAEKISDVFECEVIILLPDHSGLVERVRIGFRTPFPVTEHQVASWVLQHMTPAGRGTDTFSSAFWSYIPIKTHNGVLGVLGFRSEHPDQLVSPDRRQILVAFTNVLAISLEGMGVRPFSDA